MGDVLVKSRTDDEAERAARSADTEQRTGEGRKEFERALGKPRKLTPEESAKVTSRLEETSQTTTGIPEGFKPSERSIEDATDEDRTKTPPPKEPSKTPIGVSDVRGSKRGTLERLQSPDIDD